MKIIKYSNEYISFIGIKLIQNFKNIYLLNTPIVSKNIKINRPRPKSFFKQLKITNDLINKLVKFDINKNQLIDISKLTYTYDGVHYTYEGHKKIYEKIIKEIELC